MSIVCICDLCGCELPNSPKSAFKIGLGGIEHGPAWKYFASGDLCEECIGILLDDIRELGISIKEREST